MDRKEVIKWLKIMKANLNSFPEVSNAKKVEALAEAIRLLKNEQSENPTVLTTKNDLGVDCIDRKATLDAIIKRLGIKNEAYLLEAERVIYQQILAMPSVTPIRPKGHWIEHQHEAGANWEYSRYECSECHNWTEDDSNYCPCCGTEMDGVKSVKRF